MLKVTGGPNAKGRAALVMDTLRASQAAARPAAVQVRPQTAAVKSTATARASVNAMDPIVAKVLADNGLDRATAPVIADAIDQGRMIGIAQERARAVPIANKRAAKIVAESVHTIGSERWVKAMLNSVPRN